MKKLLPWIVIGAVIVLCSLAQSFWFTFTINKAVKEATTLTVKGADGNPNNYQIKNLIGEIDSILIKVTQPAKTPTN